MSESDGDGSFESADEGEKTTSAAAASEKKQAAKDETKEKDISNIKEKVANLSTTDNKDLSPDKQSEGAEGKQAEPKRATTPTRKANRIAEEENKAEQEGDTDDKTILEKLSDVAAKPKTWGWSGISNWGTSVLSTAQTSVTTFAGSVGEGFQNVLDTVENSLIDPDPELIAEERRQKLREQKEAANQKAGSSGSDTSSASTPSTVDTSPVQAQPRPQGETEVVGGAEAASTEGQEKTDTPKPEGEAEGGWFGGWGIGGSIGGITTAVQQTVKKTVKGTTHAFQETGKTLMTGSLDVLESIGKKTYDVLAEGDHGLKKTIKKTKEKPNLSQLLREAKEQAAEQAKQEEEFAEIRKAHYGAQFDEFQGLVQLEALEMLSNQCEGRVQGMLGSLKGQQLDAIKNELICMKEVFELKDMDTEDEDEDKDHEFDRLMADYVGQVGLNVTPEKLIHVQEKTRKVLMDCRTELDDGTQKEPKELHQQAIQALAEFTARSIELFHRVGQLILLEKSAPLSSYRTKATSLASVTRVLCAEVGISSSKFTHCLGTVANSIDNPVSVNPLITNVFLEASNSSTYIQDGFQLLLPVLQQGVIEAQQRSVAET